jgi:hypothetical protein
MPNKIRVVVTRQQAGSYDCPPLTAPALGVKIPGLCSCCLMFVRPQVSRNYPSDGACRLSPFVTDNGFISHKTNRKSGAKTGISAAAPAFKIPVLASTPARQG